MLADLSQIPLDLRIEFASVLLMVDAIEPCVLRGFVERMSKDRVSYRGRQLRHVHKALRLVMASELDARQPDNETNVRDLKDVKDLKVFLLETLASQEHTNTQKMNKWEHALLQRLQRAIVRNGLKDDILVEREFSVNGMYTVDISLRRTAASAAVGKKEQRIALEFEGPAHYLWNSMLERGSHKLRIRLLEQLGWTVVSFPYWEFARLNGHTDDKADYIEDKLAEVLEMLGGALINGKPNGRTGTTIGPHTTGTHTTGTHTEDCYHPDGTPKIVNNRFKTERVRIRGLAKEHTIADVVQFFAGADIEIDACAVVRKPDTGSTAVVAFADANEAQRAVLLDGRHIGERFMVLKQITQPKLR